MDEAEGEKQERAKRIRKRFMLRVAALSDDPLRWSYCTIHNLSASGILFTYDRSIAIGAYLYLKIDFPDRLVECTGQVTRVAGGDAGMVKDVGVRFIQILHLDQEFIDRFVEHYKDA